jgi:hypothetical protein
MAAFMGSSGANTTPCTFADKKLDQAEANFGPDGEPVSPNQSELFTRHEFQGSHIIFGGEDGEPSVSTSKNVAEAREDVDDHPQGDEQWENEADNIPVDEINYKYWYQRYTLFSKFDEGIKLDRGSMSPRFYPVILFSQTTKTCCNVLVWHSRGLVFRHARGDC